VRKLKLELASVAGRYELLPQRLRSAKPCRSTSRAVLPAAISCQVLGAVKMLLETENLIKFKPGRWYQEAHKITGPSGNEMWSLNVVVGNDEDTFVEGGVRLLPYPRP
jgi:hypothetical protein